jgi:hypothetical protein
MSDEFMQIKQAIQTLLTNPQSVNGLFSWLEGLHKQELSDISKQEELLKTIETTIPELNVLVGIARGTNNARKLNAKKFQFVYAILQVLALRNIDRKEQITYESRNMLSQEDRNALDWLSKYLEHKPGGADFE